MLLIYITLSFRAHFKLSTMYRIYDLPQYMKVIYVEVSHTQIVDTTCLSHRQLAVYVELNINISIIMNRQYFILATLFTFVIDCDEN